MQPITPCLWFEKNNAEEAVAFYCSIFKNSRITDTLYHTKEGPGPEGTVLFITFTLNGQNFSALNGGNYHSFNPAISMAVPCDNQEEIDYFWDKLLEGGEAVQCGWLKDKYGVSWQVFPAKIMEFFSNKHPEKAANASRAMHQMIKLDLAKLQEAYDKG